jgi:putative SOS response-associated peptidase YedK
MCGRYRLARHKELLVEKYGIDLDDWAPRYNIAPGQYAPVIVQDPKEPRRHGVQMRWGLVPSWAADPNAGYKMINARAETVAVKPAFRDSLKQRRCLVPADGFYEWRKSGGSKTPFCFTMKEETIFAFAGIWDSWRDPQGQTLETFCILTTTPNALVREVHDRMPVILPEESCDLWLDPGLQKTEAVCDLLQPFDARLMRRYEVSRRVNFVAHDDPACAEEVTARADR